MHYFMDNQAYYMNFFWFSVLPLLIIWELIWKGLGLWRAGRNNQLGWFLAILIINSVGILPIVYLLCFSNDKPKKK